MSIILNDLYNEIRSRYSLKLISGENGLFKAVHWLYFTEDIYNIDFLRGGELVITTGLGCKNESWLIELITKLSQHNSCGLIINTGKYITPAQITSNVKELCTKNKLPLFIMPWHIHISDIAEDIYNRFFYENKKYDVISDTLIQIAEGDRPDISHISELNFLNKDYVLFYIRSKPDIVTDRLLHITTENYSNNSNTQCRLFQYNSNFVILTENKSIDAFTSYICEYLPDICIGISSVFKGAYNLPYALSQGRNALLFGTSKGKKIMYFKDSGIYGIFFSVNETSVLSDFYGNALGKIHQYDKLHNSDFEYTLEKYIESDYSIIKTAEVTNCHRNTINYRIKKIKELFNINLDSVTTKYELYTAFKIKNFLKFIRNTEETNERN